MRSILVILKSAAAGTAAINCLSPSSPTRCNRPPGHVNYPWLLTASLCNTRICRPCLQILAWPFAISPHYSTFASAIDRTRWSVHCKYVKPFWRALIPYAATDDVIARYQIWNSTHSWGYLFHGMSLLGPWHVWTPISQPAMPWTVPPPTTLRDVGRGRPDGPVAPWYLDTADRRHYLELEWVLGIFSPYLGVRNSRKSHPY